MIDLAEDGPPPGIEMGRIRYVQKVEDIMITREWLDKHLPVDACLPLIATRCLVKHFEIAPGETNVDDLEWVLNVLAKFVEKDWHYPYCWPDDGENKPSWLRLESPDYDPSATSKMWNISIHGLTYKQRSNYLTAEGWPTGTTCWFMTVDHGWKEHVAALTPMAAALRTVVFVAALLEKRSFKPGTSKRVEDYIKLLTEEA